MKKLFLFLAASALVVVVYAQNVSVPGGVRVMRGISSTPSNGQGPVWNSTLGQWDPGSLATIFATSAELSGILSDESGSGAALFKIGGTATDYTLNGTLTNSAKIEKTTTTLTASANTITLSWTNGGEYRFTMAADTTIALANATGTNRSIVLQTYPDGTHSFIWPSGVQALTPTNQPFAAGLTTIYFDRLDGTNYVSVSPIPKPTGYQDFVFPSRVDGTGCTITTNDYTSGLWGLATYSGSADTNGNYAIFKIGTVPYDLDTSVAMTLKGFSIRVAGSDTDAAEFTIALYSPASSGAYSPSDFTACSTFINFDSGSLTSPAANDYFAFSDVTLTGWASALTPGKPFIIGIARRNGNNDDAVTIMSGTIAFGRTQ